MKLKKIVSLMMIGILFANLLLFAFRITNATTFWIIIVLAALVAFPGMRLLNKK